MIIFRWLLQYTGMLWVRGVVERRIEHHVNVMFGDYSWRRDESIRNLIKGSVKLDAFVRAKIEEAIKDYDPKNDMKGYVAATAVVLKEEAEKHLADRLAAKVAESLTSADVAKLIDPTTLNNMLQAKIAFELGNGVAQLTKGGDANNGY